MQPWIGRTMNTSSNTDRKELINNQVGAMIIVTSVGLVLLVRSRVIYLHE